jgi:hypothetical protein
MDNELASTETRALTEHEAVIERGLHTFTEVGNALLAIREQRLYRGEYDTFEQYAERRWGLARNRAYQLIEAATVVSKILDTGQPAPVVESHARELARVPEEERGEVWQQALKRTDGRPTAAAIRQTYMPAPDPVTEAERQRIVATHLLCEVVPALAQTSGTDAAEKYDPIHVLPGRAITRTVIDQAFTALEKINALWHERGLG